MSRKIMRSDAASRPVWETLETYARAQVRNVIQVLLGDEITEFLGRAKSERRPAGEAAVYRNGYGKPRRLTLLNGTITIQRPRVRGLDERFESALLPFFKRRTQVPLKKQAPLRAWLRKIMYAETQEEAERLRKQCAAQYRKLFPKAMDTLERDWDRMVTYYDYPKEHWKHLRRTNVVESPFASVRLRTSAAKRFKRVENACVLIWKLLCVAEKTFRKLNAPELLKEVAAGKKGSPKTTVAVEA